MASGNQSSLAVVETHPVQYHAPVYRALEKEMGIPVTCFYASREGMTPKLDREFGETFAWDRDLLGGYRAVFLEPAVTSSVGLLAAALRRSGARALLLPGHRPNYYLRAFVAARRVGMPVLLRGEATDHAVTRGNVKSLLRDALLRGMYRRVEGVLAIGERAHGHYVRLGVPEDRIGFSGYCIDESAFDASENARRQFRDESRSALGLLPGRRVALFSGKLVERKGPGLIIEALGLMTRPERDRWTVVFLGSGELEAELRSKAAEAGVDARFAGFRNQTKLSPVIHAADVLVLPSVRGETWGLVVNEALLHGVPVVVSSSVGCGPDLVSDMQTGVEFPSGSPEGLAVALEKITVLLGDAAVRETCRQRATTYSTAAAAEGIASLFSRVAAGTPRRGA